MTLKNTKISDSIVIAPGGPHAQGKAQSEVPEHYILDGLDVESIDVVKAVLGQKGFIKFCQGNALKYLIRAEKKNGKEDYEKARVYLDWILEAE